MRPERLEDHPRVAAPHVQDVGPDIEGVEQPDGLLEQVGQRQERDHPVVHRRDHPVDRLDGRVDVVVGEHHALGRAGGPGREDEIPDVLGLRWIPAGDLALPVGSERGVGLRHQCIDGRRRHRGEAALARVGRVAPGAVTRSRGSARWTMFANASVLIRRSSGTSTSRARIAPR